MKRLLTDLWPGIFNWGVQSSKKKKKKRGIKSTTHAFPEGPKRMTFSRPAASTMVVALRPGFQSNHDATHRCKLFHLNQPFLCVYSFDLSMSMSLLFQLPSACPSVRHVCWHKSWSCQVTSVPGSTSLSHKSDDLTSPQLFPLTLVAQSVAQHKLLGRIIQKK